MANFFIIAPNGHAFNFSFYGRGVSSLSTAVSNGSIDDHERIDGFSKRMGRIEHNLKMC